MDREWIGPQAGAQYRVRRPDWRGVGWAMAWRLGAVLGLAGVGALVAELAGAGAVLVVR